MAFQAVGLSTHIWNNNLRSIILIGLYPVIIGAVVWAISAVIGWGMAYGATDNAAAAGVYFGNGIVMAYWPLILMVIVIWFMIAWFFHGRMIRAMSHSRPVSRQEEPELYNLLENLCIARGIPMPKLEIIETHARNAFASGIDNDSYAITVTRGLLNSLTKDEVEAVLAHELTHILNRDVRLLIISIIFVGMMGLAAQLAWNSIRFGRWMPRGGRGKQDGRIILIILAIVAILSIGYLATILTRFCLSRRREYMADAGAIELTKKPEAMMSALQRIARRDQIPEVTPDVALMCTQNSKSFLGMFATHPPIDERIKAISEMTGTPVPEVLPGIAAGHEDRFGGSATGKNPWITRQRRKI